MSLRVLTCSLLVLSLALAAPTARAAGDPDKGKRVFNKCRACHVVDSDRNGIGPSLHGIVGRKAGALDGFSYSKALQNAEIVWNEQTLAKYVADPRGFVPGNKMVFPGLRKQSEVDDLIAYLKQASQ